MAILNSTRSNATENNRDEFILNENEVVRENASEMYYCEYKSSRKKNNDAPYEKSVSISNFRNPSIALGNTRGRNIKCILRIPNSSDGQRDRTCDAVPRSLSAEVSCLLHSVQSRAQSTIQHMGNTLPCPRHRTPCNTHSPSRNCTLCNTHSSLRHSTPHYLSNTTTHSSHMCNTSPGSPCCSTRRNHCFTHALHQHTLHALNHSIPVLFTLLLCWMTLFPSVATAQQAPERNEGWSDLHPYNWYIVINYCISISINERHDICVNKISYVVLLLGSKRSILRIQIFIDISVCCCFRIEFPYNVSASLKRNLEHSRDNKYK